MSVKPFITLHFNFLFLFLLLSNTSSSQDTLTCSCMSHAQFKLWDSIESKWRTEKLMPFLKSEGIKLDCAKCTGAYLWVVLQADSSGTRHEVLCQKKFGAEFNTKQFQLFYGIPLKVQLGIRLMC